MHWSDKIVLEAHQRNPEKVLIISSGISLSNHVHVGHSREFITAYLIKKAADRNHIPARFIAFADDLDPLRKRYSFLGEEYEKWIGCSLKRIPDPFGCHQSYADHFLSELINSFSQLGIIPEIFRASDLYESEKNHEHLKNVMIFRKQIAKILNNITGSTKDPELFFPFMPECPNCYSIKSTQTTGWNERSNILEFRCSRCKTECKSNLFETRGKLTWRCDWPMRWAFYSVDIEPFGHDHNTSGGSFESASVILREIFNAKSPVPAPYAWIHFKSGGAMHSSTGEAVSIADLAQTYPPEIIWWMFIRRELSSMVLFDPHDTIIEETHLLHQAMRRMNQKDVSDVCVLEDVLSVSDLVRRHSFEQLISSAQLARFNSDIMNQVLSRSADELISYTITAKEMDILKTWLTLYGKNEIVFSQTEVGFYDLTEKDVEIVEILREAFKVIELWSADAIHQEIYRCAKRLSKKPKDIFILVYKILFGKEQGPRIGWFLESIGKEETLRLFSTKQRDCS